MNLKWQKPLASTPLCAPPETCTDTHMVNAAAVSDNGNRAVAATYYFNYEPHMRSRLDGTYGTFVYNTNSSGTLLFKDEFSGDQGMYCVAMSGDGKTAAAGGLIAMPKQSPFKPKRGLLRAYEVPSGNSLLDTDEFSERVTSISLSRTGKVLAAVADRDLRVFIRTSGAFTDPPHTFTLDGQCPSVAVHSSGDWLTAADENGRVYVFTISGGTVNPPKKWIALERRTPGSSAPKIAVTFRCVAVAREVDLIVAGGKDFVYLLSPASIAASPPGPLARYLSFDAGEHHDVRWVAITDDGSFMTAVMNDRDQITDARLGQIVKLTRSGDTLVEEWKKGLDHNPNSTSIDGAGTLITASDGFPNDTPGTLYLFDANGTSLGTHGTMEMCWPMSISKDGTGIIGGDDDNQLYFFTP
jgi:WD40 repeat protein